MPGDFSHLARQLTEVDRIMHEPARTLIVTILHSVESCDFLYLQRETGLTKGNLSAHLTKLEDAGYIQIEKTYRGKIPLTLCQLTQAGKEAFSVYRQRIKEIIDHPASSATPKDRQE